MPPPNSLSGRAATLGPLTGTQRQVVILATLRASTRSRRRSAPAALRLAADPHEPSSASIGTGDQVYRSPRRTCYACDQVNENEPWALTSWYLAAVSHLSGRSFISELRLPTLPRLTKPQQGRRKMLNARLSGEAQCHEMLFGGTAFFADGFGNVSPICKGIVLDHHSCGFDSDRSRLSP
jgi:hypothetical protein